MTSKEEKKKPSSLTLHNPRVIEFYNKNKHIDIEKVNILYIDLLENVLNASVESPSMLNQIMLSLGNQNRDLNNLLAVITNTGEIHKSELSNIKTVYNHTTDNIKSEIEGLKNVISNLSSFITTKLYETKDNYIKELKDTLKNTDSSSILNIGLTVEKYNNSLIDKINLILNEVIPKSHNKQYEDIISVFKNDMITSLDKIKPNNTDNTIDRISLLVDTKYNNLVSTIQEKMLNSISQSEDRLNTNISQVRDLSLKTSLINEKINEDLSVYLNKSKISSIKGNISETILFNLIEKEYTSGELVNTSSFSGMGDMILKRTDMVPILIENKDYTSNVRREEIEKFIRDIDNTKHHGIFISQHSGVVGKNNFQIDIHNKNILIYIHNCDYDIDKIKLAITTIDTLSDKLIDINTDVCSITNDMIKDMNTDYQTFLTHRDNVLYQIKDNYKKTVEILTHMKLPSLEKYLSTHFAENKTNKLTCNLCKKYQTNNLRSLARHTNTKMCKKMQDVNSDTISETKSDTISDTNISDTSSTCDTTKKNTKKNTTKYLK